MADEMNASELMAVLENRENRWRRRLELAKKCDTLVSITLCVPIEYRRNDKWKRALENKAREVEARLSRCGYPVYGRERAEGADGLVIFLLTEGGAKLKRLCTELEEELSGGRLLDIDVTCGKPLSRMDLGLAPRRCFVCGRPAAECVASRRHSSYEIASIVEGSYPLLVEADRL